MTYSKKVRHCEERSDVAIYNIDCFAPLAMTYSKKVRHCEERSDVAIHLLIASLRSQ